MWTNYVLGLAITSNDFKGLLGSHSCTVVHARQSCIRTPSKERSRTHIKLGSCKLRDRKRETHIFNLHLAPSVSPQERANKAPTSFGVSGTNSSACSDFLQSATMPGRICHLSPQCWGKSQDLSSNEFFLTERCTATHTDVKTASMPCWEDYFWTSKP